MHKGTERPFSGEYDRHLQPGTYPASGAGRPSTVRRTSSTPAAAGLPSTTRSRAR